MRGDRLVRLTVKRFRGGLTGLLLLATGLVPATLSAQEEALSTADSGTGVEFMAFAGVIQPLANLTATDATFGTVISPDVTFGGELTFWTSRTVGIGFTGLYSPANLSAFATGFQGAIPDDLGSVNYLVGTANLTFRIRPSGSAGSLEPYLTIGGGVRHMELAAIASPEAETSTDPAASIGAGVRVRITSGLWFRGEFRDIASFYESPSTGESRLQNDMAITIGFGIR